MAWAPQPPDSPQDPSGPILNAHRRIEEEVGGGPLFSWGWIGIPLILAALWFAGWGWGPYGGWWWGRASSPHAPRSATVMQPASSSDGAPNATGTPAPETATAPTNQGTAASANALPGASPAAGVTGSGVAVLQAGDKRKFIGQPFQITNILVQKIDNDHALWIGAGNQPHAGPMLVIFPSGTVPAIGHHVDVTGTVEKAPPAAQARQNWDISQGDVRSLERQGVYVHASQLLGVQP